jgi:DNA-binding Xre family transcriptional regulator
MSRDCQRMVTEKFLKGDELLNLIELSFKNLNYFKNQKISAVLKECL